MEPKKRAYYLSVAESLAECQLVEFELRFYIASAFELIAKQTPHELPFRMTARELGKARKDYKRASLGKLTGYFAKLSDSPALVASLVKFGKERNHLAHTALAVCIDPSGELDHAMVKKLSGRVAVAKAEALRINEAIYEIGCKWIIYLYFDPIPSETAETSGAF